MTYYEYYTTERIRDRQPRPPYRPLREWLLAVLTVAVVLGTLTAFR